MIIKEIKTIDSINYKYTYSNSNKLILQKETGILYADALDDINSNYTYEESDLNLD